MNTKNVTLSDIIESTSNYKLAYESEKYANQKIEFLQDTDLVAISDSVDITIINLNDNSIVKKLKLPNSGITAALPTRNGKNFIVFTDLSAQIYDIRSWELIKIIDGNKLSKLSGVSPYGDFFNFAGSLWSINTHEEIVYYEDEPIPADYSFSKDGQFFIAGGSYFGAVIVNIKEKTMTTKRIHNLADVKFRDDNNFYASYDSKFIVEQGGYRAKTIGLFDIKINELIEDHTFKSRITCWENTSNNGLLVGLFNGDILLLNQTLEITHKWHIDDHIYSCKQGNNKEIWLGGYTSGLYKADLTSLGIKHLLKSSNMISDIKLSEDNKYLGIVENISGGSTVKIYELTLSETKSLGPR